MILHLFETDRFADLAINRFEAVAPGDNLYLVDLKKRTEDLALLKRKDIASTYDLNRIWENIESLRSFDFVVLHGFSVNMIRLIAKAPVDIKFVWAPWGGEIYSRTPEFVDHCNLSVNENDLLRQDFDFLLKRQYTPFSRNIYPAARLAYSKLRMCVMGFEEEYKGFCSRMPYLKAEWMPWAYHALSEQYDAPKGKNIIVGNSASPTNNHIEILEMLARLPLDDREVIVPLSYGDMNYAGIVVAAGERLLGKRFRPLLDFLAYDEYQKIFMTCDTVIMNHVQERGFGNVMIALNNGINVFLRSDSVTRNLLSSIGVNFFLTAELSAGKTLNLLQLKEDDIRSNRAILHGMFSAESLEAKTRDIIKRAREMV